MISEYFLDICLSLSVSIESKRKNCKELLNSIESILKFYKKETSSEKFPLMFKDKFDVLEHLVKERVEKNNFDLDVFIDTLNTGKYKTFSETLKDRKCEYSDEQYDLMLKLVLSKKKLFELIKGKSDLEKLLQDIDICNYKNDEEIISNWENNVSKLYTNMMNVKKIEMIQTATSLDLKNDDISFMLDKLRETIDNKETLPTGYQYLKDNLPSDGLETRRLYLIGGTSGVGKSTLLINFMRNAIEHICKNKSNKKETFLYITAENLIDETWVRFYCCLTGIPHNNFVEEINNIKNVSKLKLSVDNDVEGANNIIKAFDKKLKDQVNKYLEDSNCNIVMKYVPSKNTTVRDIESIIDSVISEHENLTTIFIDYLDLFSTGQNLETRHELGLVTKQFKNIAVAYGVRVVTATQLNREGYKTDNAPSLTQVGESIQKIDNSDFVLFLQDDKDGIISVPIKNGQSYMRKIRATILKNRNGSIGETCSFLIPTYKVENNKKYPTFCFRIEECRAELKPEYSINKARKEINLDKTDKDNLEKIFVFEENDIMDVGM